MSWAFSLPGLSPGEKLTLLALANCADTEGHCFPSQERIARDTCQGQRTVRGHLTTLAERGLLAKSHRRRQDGTRTSDEYVLNIHAAISAGGEAVQPAESAATNRQDLPVHIEEEPSEGTVTIPYPTDTGADDAPREKPEAHFYREGKLLCGRNAGGLLTKLLAEQGLPASMRVLEQARGAENPKEYVAAVVHGTGPPADIDYAELRKQAGMG